MSKWLLFFCLISATAFSQRTVEGRIVDKETGKPVPYASIGISGTSQGTSSNLNGEFSLSLPRFFSVKVSCVGYESIVINSLEGFERIELKPISMQLNDVYIIAKEINPKRIVRKAFSNIPDNYNEDSFLQKFFYRQYNKTDSVYESLVEASVDVWKYHGYGLKRKLAGEKEEMRVNQLRRSLDITGMVQQKKPISIGYILQSDLVGYQTQTNKSHSNAFLEVCNLKLDFEKYNFVFDGLTNYDGQEVYKINYSAIKDSVLTTSGYVQTPSVSGTLFITTDNFAFIKAEEIKKDEFNTLHTIAYYRKFNHKYYPYHFTRDGENRFHNQVYSFHIDLISIEVAPIKDAPFYGKEPTRSDLLNIPFDSTFWNTTSILKTTPLEDDIITDLGRGQSLNKQFYLFKQYEANVTEGDKKGLEKFNWLKEDSKGKRILYVCVWESNFKSVTDLVELEHIKRLNQVYKNKITFVMLSLEDDATLWKQLVTKYNLFADGIINYKIGSSSKLLDELKVRKIPAFILIAKDGNMLQDTKRPSDVLLAHDLQSLIDTRDGN